MRETHENGTLNLYIVQELERKLAKIRKFIDGAPGFDVCYKLTTIGLGKLCEKIVEAVYGTPIERVGNRRKTV